IISNLTTTVNSYQQVYDKYLQRYSVDAMNVNKSIAALLFVGSNFIRKSKDSTLNGYDFTFVISI
ncbi:hypothetical protein, partial [Pelotomaculum sp. FP]|uniref:hypothetical protein n=1 Tax=Pelotomaculum sp. FP TaxID=261474 RepID=UPI001961CA2B